MTKTVTWTTGSGQSAKVVIELVKETGMIADHTTKKAVCDINYTAFVDGKEVGRRAPVKISHPVAVARIGDLAMTQVNHDRVKQAVADIKQSPYVVAWHKNMAAQEKEMSEYEAHRSAMHTVMGY